MSDVFTAIFLQVAILVTVLYLGLRRIASAIEDNTKALRAHTPTPEGK